MSTDPSSRSATEPPPARRPAVGSRGQPDDPYLLVADGDQACLLVHGSTGTAGDLRGLADHLHAGGLTVRGIALPGHHRRPAQLAGITWQDGFAAVRQAWTELRGRYRVVHVIGFSYGGSLALHLAARHPVEDLVLLAPGLHVHLSRRDLAGAGLGLLPGTWMHDRLRWNLDLLAFLRRVGAELQAVRSPLLIMHARDDTLVRLRGSLAIFDRVASRDRRLVVLARGGHRLPWGPAHRRVWEEVARWIGGHAERRAARPAAAGCGDPPPHG